MTQPFPTKFRYLLLGVIILFAATVRWPYISSGLIPFQFDHGKDSMAILHLIQTYSPKLIGPWTSIPGLFFGPAWYYLLAPGYIIGQGHPASAVMVMIALILLQVALAYYYFGWEEALIIATAPAWLTLSKSAWNPFPMTLVSLLILIGAQDMKENGVTWQKVMLMALVASVGFHFSAAFAVFFFAIIPAILWWNGAFPVKKLAVALKHFLAMGIGFVIPFGPQIIFEVRHDFLQTKAVLKYFSESKEVLPLIEKMTQVWGVTWGEIKLAVLPGMVVPYWGIRPEWITTLSLGLLAIGAGWVVWKKQSFSLWFETLLFLIIPFVGFSFLHFNVWYVLAMLPVAVLLVGHILRKSPLVVRSVYAALLILTPVMGLKYFYEVDQAKLARDVVMLPLKVQALETIYEKSQGQPFASYHYVSDIYDYSYQYLYFWHILYKDKKVPTEFSYKPGEIAYIKEKPDLLAKLAVPAEQPTYIFFIVEKPEKDHLLQEWWNHQHYGPILETIPIGDHMTVYKALPEASSSAISNKE